MYYEFYIDVFFVVNLVMDFYLLRLANRFIKGNATPFRSLLSAAAGAAGFCVIVLFPGLSPFLQVLLSHGLLGVFMVKFGCKIRTWKRLLYGVLVFYGASFLTGGILQALPGRTKDGICIFFITTAATYWILIISMRLLKYLKGKSSAICQVTLQEGGKTVKVKGLYDTGNRLRDTSSKKPVCVLEYGKFRELLEESQMQCFENMMEHKEDEPSINAETILSFCPHYLIYHSVGQENGLMLAVTIEELSVSKGEEDQQVKKPVLGLTRNRLSQAGSFQMIINPGIFDD